MTLLPSACGSDDDQPATTGSTSSISGSETGIFPLGAFGAGESEVAASIGYIEFGSNGTGRVLGLRDGIEDPAEFEFTYELDGDRVVVASVVDNGWGCDAGSTGSYRWSAVNSVLSLEPVDELCAAREESLQVNRGDGAWYPLGEVPIVDSQTIGESVTVDTPIGAIEWVLVEGQQYVAPPALFGDRFVAITGERSEDTLVVVSSNGRDWEPLPQPPKPAQFFAVRGDDLYVIAEAVSEVPDTTTAGPSPSPPWPPTVYTSSNSGSSWQEIDVGPASLDGDVRVVGMAAGGAGVVIETSSPGPLWVFGPEGFEMVEPAFIAGTDAVEVTVIDSGFFAIAVTDSGPGEDDIPTSWTSVDGREWTQVTDSAEVLGVYATSGDTLYGTVGGNTGIVSHDGGRTWEAPTQQPGGGGDYFALVDSGFLAIETVIFGPCVGVVWVSADGTDWQRVLNPWPAPAMGEPVIKGDTILIPSGTCQGPEHGLGDWIGTIG
jgi:hypothetical protein